MESRHILIVEDDPTQLDLIKEELDRRLHCIRITDIQTESEFRSGLEEILKNPPALILMDMMLRWTDPAPELPEMPDEVEGEGYYRAGIRCTRQILEANEGKYIPILLFTVLGREDIKKELEELGSPESVRLSYLSKTARASDLIDEIVSLAPEFKDHLFE